VSANSSGEYKSALNQRCLIDTKKIMYKVHKQKMLRIMMTEFILLNLSTELCHSTYSFLRVIASSLLSYRMSEGFIPFSVAINMELSM
jgi:hypothetical protein